VTPYPRVSRGEEQKITTKGLKQEQVPVIGGDLKKRSESTGATISGGGENTEKKMTVQRDDGRSRRIIDEARVLRGSRQDVD